MAKILNEASVKVMGVPATVSGDCKKRIRFDYADDGVSKSGLGFVQLVAEDTPSTAKTKAITEANSILTS